MTAMMSYVAMYMIQFQLKTLYTIYDSSLHIVFKPANVMLSFENLQTVDILFRLLYLIENKRFPYNKKTFSRCNHSILPGINILLW